MRIRTAAAAGLAAILASTTLLAIVPTPSTDAKEKLRALVFSKTAGFRHDSIPAGIAAIRAIGAKNGVGVTATERAATFTPKRLRTFDVVIFLNTTGDVLGRKRQRAFRAYIRRGGGFVGIHSASDTEHDWPFYGTLVGAYFKSHPAVQPATIQVDDPSHPSTLHLPKRWARTDEWYDFTSNPRGRVHVLATLDESTYTGGGMGDHPIAWCHTPRGGRSWYTAGGHTIESFSEPLFRRHLLGGVLWAAGRVKGGCRPGSA